MKADITLKEGKSYRWRGHIVRSDKATTLTDPAEIAAAQDNGMFAVTVHQDKPVEEEAPKPTPKPAVATTKPLPKPATPVAKPGPKPAAPKPTPKPADPAEG